ncbi:hydantoinase/carbamoylase family amidase [Plastoroseomonas hellenica]|uniref:hydantoinase/carbamoylase family amidase n=1 Tax=Plastoroseomonas hellenica TaxID=2687306 RepID=UPI001BAB6212|nr:hydantoinase/carbamoylase family amidase [Plastoroseomonas hellenica]MBR0643103.1 hydantoinase/carbamoylase family amidase [Plastoroseomonas hellenica]
MAFDTALREIAEQAWEVMEAIGRHTGTPEAGITRACYGEGEQIAAEKVTAFAAGLGLALEPDRYGNLHVLVPGAEPDAKVIMTGSHLDSVPGGGNYDGLAGVMASLSVAAAALRAGGHRRGIRAVAMRGEESPWFGTAYVGSRLMLGHSTLEEIGALTRIDSGVTLREHLDALGYADAPALPISKEAVAGFFELHIEQGPLLIANNLPVAVATDCRGNIRYPEARCLGEYGHSAALPRAFRHDAVMAVAELALEFERFWAEVETRDPSAVFTMGKLGTDPAAHAMTKVPGEARFSFNFGSIREDVLAEADALLTRLLATIGQRRGVQFEMGARFGSAPSHLDPGLAAAVEGAAQALGIGAMRLATVGHDAAMFHLAGIPASVMLVRNAHGSHNPREAMERADFLLGTRVLGGAVMRAAA